MHHGPALETTPGPATVEWVNSVLRGIRPWTNHLAVAWGRTGQTQRLLYTLLDSVCGIHSQIQAKPAYSAALWWLEAQRGAFWGL